MKERIKSFIHSLLLYKILVDILSLLLIVTIAFIISETIIPGIISTYISPITIFAGIFTMITAISFIAHKQNIAIPLAMHNRFSTSIAIVFFLFVITIAGFHYGYIFESIIIILSTITFILLHALVHDMIHD